MTDRSILNTIKKLFGMADEYTAFDTDLIININSVFAILHQMGIGPDKGYSIVDKSNEWDEFITDKHIHNELVSYIYLKVKLLFDPPANATILNSINSQISELEWRLYTAHNQY